MSAAQSAKTPIVFTGRLALRKLEARSFVRSVGLPFTAFRLHPRHLAVLVEGKALQRLNILEVQEVKGASLAVLDLAANKGQRKKFALLLHIGLNVCLYCGKAAPEFGGVVVRPHIAACCVLNHSTDVSGDIGFASSCWSKCPAKKRKRWLPR